jgi:hypothetical protein
MTAADEAGRSQDQGRRHRRAGNPSPETASLLARYQSSMRNALSHVLDELEPRVPDPGLGLDPVTDPVWPPLKDSAPRWDLAIKLGRELGTEVDGSARTDTAQPAVARGPGRRKRIDFG